MRIDSHPRGSLEIPRFIIQFCVIVAMNIVEKIIPRLPPEILQGAFAEKPLVVDAGAQFECLQFPPTSRAFLVRLLLNNSIHPLRPSVAVQRSNDNK